MSARADDSSTGAAAHQLLQKAGVTAVLRTRPRGAAPAHLVARGLAPEQVAI